MPFENTRSLSFNPTSALVNKNRFVTLVSQSSEIKVSALGVSSNAVAGISAEESPAGETAAIPVIMLDGCKAEIEAGGTITQGDPLTTNDAGQAITATIGTTGFGVALESASAGEIITILAKNSAGLAAVGGL